MGRILGYFVLIIIALVGFSAIRQMNSVRGLLEIANEEMLSSDWEDPYYYRDGPVEPTPSDYGEPLD